LWDENSGKNPIWRRLKMWEKVEVISWHHLWKVCTLNFEWVYNDNWHGLGVIFEGNGFAYGPKKPLIMGWKYGGE